MKNEKLNTIKSTGFKIPDNYLSNFDELIFEKIEAQNAIKNIDNTGFEVPNDYFKTLDSKILNQIQQSDKKPKIMSLFSKQKLIYISGIAASFILMFSIFLNKQETEIFSVETVENYLADSDLDSYDLAQLLNEANILDDDFSLIETTNTEENLEEYLLENADFESIIE